MCDLSLGIFDVDLKIFATIVYERIASSNYIVYIFIFDDCTFHQRLVCIVTFIEINTTMCNGQMRSAILIMDIPLLVEVYYQKENGHAARYPSKEK